MGWKDRKGLLGRLHNALDALGVTPPSTARPEPSTPPRASPRARPTSRPTPEPPSPQRISYVSRGDLPDEWGRNQSALWQDATRFDSRLANDDVAQMYYDAALYTFSDSHEDRADAIKEFKRYILDEYGVDWDDIFDWEEWRANYDTVAG